MNELFPVVAGAAIGLAVSRLAAGRLRLFALIVLSVSAGFIASLISGEIALGPGFIPIDVAQTLIAAVLARAVVVAWQRSAVRLR